MTAGTPRLDDHMGTSTIGLNDFSRQWDVIGSDVRDAVERVGRSGWYVLGREVDAFEQCLADTCGVEHAVGCASGLDALELALRANGLQPGDRVLTTPLSAFATTLAIVRAGGTPLFVDVDEDGLLDLELVAEALRRHDGIRFLLPVHLFGRPLDMSTLEELADTYGLQIVEDCAQAVGASHGKAVVGSVGSAGGLSFYPTKNLGCMGDGGAVLSQDGDVAIHVRSLRDYGQTTKYEHDLVGMNSRLDELQAAILRSAMLPRLGTWTARRREIASRYLRAFEGTALRTLREAPGSEPVWHLFPVLLANTTGRDSLLAHLGSRGIRTAIHYPFVIPDQPAMAAVPGWSALTPLHQARQFATTALSLPVHPFLTDDEVSTVIDACLEWSP